MYLKGSMKLSVFRNQCKQEFEKLNIDKFDVDCIFAEVLNMKTTELHVDIELTYEQIKLINSAVVRRKSGEPVTKIFNKAYFFGQEFYVDNNVLSPRPETEILVEYAIDWLKSSQSNCTVLDLCTGSGAIACSIAKLSNVEVYASDISSKALDIAKRNARNLGCDIKFVLSDMFTNISGQFDMIISNPPYIETEVCKTLDVEVKEHDPMLALDGGEDGLDYYRIIASNMHYLKKGGILLMEIGYNQAESIKTIFNNYHVTIVKDYGNNDRIAIVKGV